VWNTHSTTPVSKFNDHTAAVKAIAWSPRQQRFVGIWWWNGRQVLSRRSFLLYRSYNWDEELSRGEMQRLGFVRVIFTKPFICNIDEAIKVLLLLIMIHFS